jgi:hypothetical protein
MREKLSGQVGNVFWSDLRAHALRDALVVVGEGLDLVEVGEALARDDAKKVEAWLAAGKLGKPSAADLATWAEATGAVFESLIVAPFVLVRKRRDRLN